MAAIDDRQSVEFAKCLADPAYFAHHWLWIDDAQGHGEGGGTMPFKLWPDQATLLWTLMSERLVLILKARQLGISWICCAYALWLCVFTPGQLVLLFSQGEREAIELLRRVKVLYERLPAWLKDSLPAVIQDNTTICAWANGSRVESLPATQKAGRGNAASLVIADEFAHIQWADELYTAMKPTIDGGGRLIVLSTANGVGNLFHRLWIKCAGGMNAFRAVFLPWWARPGRDQAWYDRQIAESDDPDKVKQEYPSNATEAFRVSGRTRFLQDWVDRQSPNVADAIDARLLPDPLNGIDGLRVYELPPDPATLRTPARKLILACDVAEGLEGGDYSAAVLIDADTLEELACLHGHWEPDEYAERLYKISEAYGAKIVVERNNHGHAVLSKLKGLGSRRIADGPDERPGWLTGVLTKPVAVDALAAALRDGAVKVRSRRALDEFMVYTVLANGKTSSPSGYHDDLVMAWAIALGWKQMVGWKVAAGAPVIGGPSRAPSNVLTPQRPAPGRIPIPGAGRRF